MVYLGPITRICLIYLSNMKSCTQYKQLDLKKEKQWKTVALQTSGSEQVLVRQEP